MIETLTFNKCIIIALIILVAIALRMILNDLIQYKKVSRKIHELNELTNDSVSFKGQYAFAYNIQDQSWIEGKQYSMEIFDDTIEDRLKSLGMNDKSIDTILTEVTKEANNISNKRNSYRIMTYWHTDINKASLMLNIVLINL